MSDKQTTLIPELLDEIERDQHVPNIVVASPDKKKRPRFHKGVIIGAGIVGLIALLIDIDLPVSGIAHVVPSQLLTIEAMESGIVENVYFKSGQEVKKKDVIVELSNADLSRGLKESKLKLNIIRKQLLKLDRSRNYLRLMLDNYVELYHDEIIARSELEKVRLDYTHSLQEYDIYQDEMETLRGKINYYQEAMHKMKVNAPMEGIILTKIENKLGTFVKKGDELCQLANMNDYLLELPINEKVIDAFSVKTKATVRFLAYPEKPIQAEVVEIRHTAWKKLKKVLVTENVINIIIRLEDMSLPVKPGMTAHVKIHSGKIDFRGRGIIKKLKN